MRGPARRVTLGDVTHDGDAVDAARLVVVGDRVVLRDAVVPDADGSLRPRVATGQLGLFRVRAHSIAEQRRSRRAAAAGCAT